MRGLVPRAPAPTPSPIPPLRGGPLSSPFHGRGRVTTPAPSPRRPAPRRSAAAFRPSHPRQRIPREPAGLGDFHVGLERRLPELPQHEAGDMVAGEILVIEEQPMQHRSSSAKIPASSSTSRTAALKDRFAALDAAARKQPARCIGMPHQQDLSRRPDDHRARAERQRPELPVHGCTTSFCAALNRDLLNIPLASPARRPSQA